MNTRTLNMERQPPQDQQAVQWLSELLTHSLELQASDIHLEPFDNLLRVRVRRDGKLYEMPAPAASLREQIISRIKVQSRLDIAEKRLPQDGRLQWAVHQRMVDMRVSSLPTLHGEKLVLRILDIQSQQLSFEHLGLPHKELDQLMQAIQPSLNARVKHLAVNSRELTDFTRQLATLVSSGVPLLESLDAVHKGFDGQAMAHIVDQMKSRVSAGWALHQALQEHAVFGHLYCQMVAAGEVSGNLDEMLNRLALHTERQQQLMRKLRMALVYPVAVLLIAFGVVAVILIWVVPVFQSIFVSFGAELPFATQLIVNLSKHLLHWGLPVILVLAALAVIVRWQYQRDDRWQWLLAVWVLRLPVVSHLIGSANLVIWTRCMAMLVQSGVPLLDTLQIVAGTCTNRVYALSTLTVHDKVMQGISLAQALRQLSSDADGYPAVFSKLYPSLLVQLIDIGEQSGTLSALLNKAADAQDEALAHQVQSMTQLIEPLLVVVLGGLVGGMVVALYLPVFQLGQIM